VDERPLPGRYRGRRRVPTAPRSRYAAVFTTAMVGAGVVALGAGAALPDAKLDPDRLSTLGGFDSGVLDERMEAAERASRAERQRGGLATSITQAAPDVWLLPVQSFNYSSAYGWRWGRMHNGVDLAAPQGTPVVAMHAGTVTMSRYSGGYGYAVVIDHGDGVETLYAHNSQLLVYEGQEVAAGERIALVGNTGYSFGSHVHLEVHEGGVPQDPVPWLLERGVDIIEQTEAIFGTSG
jgi:murein DD-endopeptidase MepM/ murein hydrolase activator NlpD